MNNPLSTSKLPWKEPNTAGPDFPLVAPSLLNFITLGGEKGQETTPLLHQPTCDVSLAIKQDVVHHNIYELLSYQHPLSNSKAYHWKVHDGGRGTPKNLVTSFLSNRLKNSKRDDSSEEIDSLQREIPTFKTHPSELTPIERIMRQPCNGWIGDWFTLLSARDTCMKFCQAQSLLFLGFLFIR